MFKREKFFNVSYSKHKKKKLHIICINCITRKIVLNFPSLSTSGAFFANGRF